MITKELLHELFSYKDGELYWKKRRKNQLKAGEKAGYITDKGYLRIKVNGVPYGAHTLIYMMFHGNKPSIIDHADRNPLNNRIENLRPSTKTTNGYNRSLNKDNTSGFKNIYKKGKKWSVNLTVNGIQKYFGSYFDIEVAKFIAETMRNKYHGEFANHGLE